MIAITGARHIDRREHLLIPRVPVPKQPPEQRVFNFHEVYLGYNEETVQIEASRCIQCPEPQACISACPVNNDIPLAMWHTARGEFVEGYLAFRKNSTMSEVCGRVCPQEKLCQGSCVVGSSEDPPVYIGKVEFFLADWMRIQGKMGDVLAAEKQAPTGRTVAIVGSGPAGLHAAELLALKGHHVDVYERHPMPGGLLMYGIPDFKLEKDKVQGIVARCEQAGVRFITNTPINTPGNPYIEDLLYEYDATLIAIGAEIPSTMGTEGEDLPGVWTSLDFLISLNLQEEMFPSYLQAPDIQGKTVMVVGGGDTSSDCVRSAVRAGAGRVILSYRRSEAQMPGRAEDRGFAKDEGVEFEFLTQPVRFIPGPDGKLAQVELRRMKLGEPDKSGRRRPVPIPDSEFVTDVDIMVLALGFWPDEKFAKATPGMDTKRWGEIKVDPETGMTSRIGLWAAGDAVNGADLVVTAMAGARKAADSIHEYLLELSEEYARQDITPPAPPEAPPGLMPNCSQAFVVKTPARKPIKLDRMA
jgi:glutamate synthase (NADPH/NADH) small chain